jgi:hypothetical protein
MRLEQHVAHCAVVPALHELQLVTTNGVIEAEHT